MRFLTEHAVNPANDKLAIRVADEPGHGGANHDYRIEYNPEGKDGFVSQILFQCGPILEDGNGVNGITNEALLAIVADRLRAFRNGPYGCKENADALSRVVEALHCLHQRTLERMRRGVEGTHTV